MSDGGDGFGQVLSRLVSAQVKAVSAVDAAHRPRQANWWWAPRTRTAIIESAQTIGLALLPPGQYHPFELDTFGLCAVLEAAADSGAIHCVLGIGGSATNDGGFGLAHGLGWEFLDAKDQPIRCWTGLASLAHLCPPKHRRLIADLRVAVDVQNVLLGPKGATRVYGPQKGLKSKDFHLAESCLRRLATVVRKDLKLNHARLPGAGAAGGLGFGLASFFGARLEPGFSIFARYAKLSRRLRTAQLVVTGEGAIDASSLMGKGVGEIAKMCRQFRVPCLGLAGMIGDRRLAARHFTQAQALSPDLADAVQAKARAAYWLTRLSAQAARNY
jgi:glycerate kinase